jgi:hypothetical protein
MKQGMKRLAPGVASWVSCALATGFACAALIACGGDVEPTESDESDLSRSATTTPAPAEKEAPPPAAPARAATREESSTPPSQSNLGNQGIGAANHDDNSDKQIKRPPE